MFLEEIGRRFDPGFERTSAIGILNGGRKAEGVSWKDWANLEGIERRGGKKFFLKGAFSARKEFERPG